MRKSQRKARTTRLFYIALGLVVVGGLGALTYVSTRQPGAPASQYDSSLPAVQSNGYVLGSPTAPVEVTEYADFECPSCGQFTTVIEPDIRTNYVNTGKVRWRFIDFPLPMHRNTWNASRAAACAEQQGKFWEMHDIIFQNQDRWNGDVTHNPDAVLKGLARQIGLNTQQFDACVDSRQTQAKIQAHYRLGEAAQVNATPTFVIGGRQYPGLRTYDELAKLLDQALTNAAAAAPAHAPATRPASKR